MTPARPLMLPQAVLFDMDGTLTRPMLDFPAIKREMGIGDRAILEAMAEMSARDRQRCDTILDRHEQHAAAHSLLNPGCHETLADLRALGVRLALVTRNSRQSVDTVLARHGLSFPCVVSRETCTPKPDARAVLFACAALDVAAGDAWMVGDGRYDIEAGNAAGVPTVWVSHGERRSFDAMPWREVRDLWELRAAVQQARTSA